jgi:hypothetical protein
MENEQDPNYYEPTKAELKEEARRQEREEWAKGEW